jgi:hypothetical protein
LATTVRGTYVPVEEPSTASQPELGERGSFRESTQQAPLANQTLAIQGAVPETGYRDQAASHTQWQTRAIHSPSNLRIGFPAAFAVGRRYPGVSLVAHKTQADCPA